MRPIAFLLAFLAVSPSLAQNGPFGISMGDPVSKHGCVEDEQDGWYVCEEIPEPHSALEAYYVFGKEEYGIIVINASGRVYKNDKSGMKVKRAVDKIAEQMKRKYGEWDDYIDYIQPSSILTKSSEWSLSLYKRERIYGYVWEFEPSEIRDNITGIVVETISSDTNDTQLGVIFVFENNIEYNKEKALSEISSGKLFGIAERDTISDYDCEDTYVEGYLNIPKGPYGTPYLGNSPAQDWMDEYIFQCNTILNTHPYMETYYVTATEEKGIVHIAAVSKSFEKDIENTMEGIADYLNNEIFHDQENMEYNYDISRNAYSWEWHDMLIDLYLNNKTSFVLSFYFPSYFNLYWEINHTLEQKEQAAKEQAEAELRRQEAIARQQAEEARKKREKEAKKEATEELLYLYLENPIAGELKYKGNNIVLGGFVTNMEIIDDLTRSTINSFYGINAIAIIQITFHDNPLVEALGNAVISGLGGSELGGVNCWLDRKNSQDAITLNRSHYVEIQGVVQGQMDLVSPYDVNVYPCSIIAQSANEQP